jgi:hypothetical protein
MKLELKHSSSFWLKSMEVNPMKLLFRLFSPEVRNC